MNASRRRHMENGTFMWVQNRDDEKTSSQINLYLSIRPISVSPAAPFISLLTLIKLGSGDHRHLVTLQVATQKNTSSPLFPICYYLLLEITTSKLQSVRHKHTLFCWETCFTGTCNPPQKRNQVTLKC